ncbi:MAG: tetratricopeptide repeat protein [Thermoanaerobaculia bacterium]
MKRLAPILLISSLALFTTGCLTMKPRSMNPTASATVIETVPMRTWGDNTCGSGALSAVLNHYGDPATEAELDAAFPKGRAGGVVSIDLLIEARRRGFDAELLKGDEALVLEHLGEGTPVILMLQIADMPGENRDLYHYVIADGYDAEKGLVRLQFGDGKARWTKLATLEKPWSGAGHATFVVRHQPLEKGLRQAVLLEEKGSLAEARDLLRQLAEKNPGSALPWTNLGNVQARLGARSEAESAYREALRIAPAERDAANNLAWLLFEERRLHEAEPLARQAVEFGGPDPHLAWDTLAHILSARGECTAAGTAWRHALESPTIDADSRRRAERALASGGCLDPL